MSESSLSHWTKNDAYDEGRNCQQAGISVQANPWPVFDPKYQQWAMGWLDAQNGRPPPKRLRRRSARQSEH